MNLKLLHHNDTASFIHPYPQSGIVYQKNIGSYFVRADGRTVRCMLPGNSMKSDPGKPGAQGVRQKTSNKDEFGEANGALAVGDQVRFIETDPGSGMIVETLPRRNQLSRRSAVPMPGAHASEQVIVANVDQIMPVFAAANPTPKWGLLDRYLVSAESAEIPALICITKIDLIEGHPENHSEESDLSQVVEGYRRIGYPVIVVSAASGEGIEELAAALQGKTSVLLGKSGVGKTSLLNRLQPDLGMRVKQVNRVTGKGKHTTTRVEMFPLDWGGALVDTPGIREFGLWEVDGRDLAWFFPEMRPWIGKCRFGLDCRHNEEPGCAIRQAVVGGEISPYRYRSYIRLKEEV